MGTMSPSERTPIVVIDDDDESRPIPVSFPDGGYAVSTCQQYRYA
jgi:hypothetical protein